MKSLSRKLEPTLGRVAREFPIVVLTGARQTGKTTLLRHAFGSTHAYFALDDPDTRARATSDPKAFLREAGERAILDEIQSVPDLLVFLKNRVDADRRPGAYLLSGSQTFALMSGISESLAGRAVVLHLSPLAQNEIPIASRLPTADEFLLGGFPSPRLHLEAASARNWMSSYVQTYLERDVRQITNVGDLSSFDAFLRLCASRTAQIVNFADLARDAGVATANARRWLSVLETSALFVPLRPFARSMGKRMVKAPKLFCVDTGLAGWLTGHRDADVLRHGPMRGALFETAVHAEIIKAFANAGDVAPLYYWRSSDGLEVDFVLELAGRLHGIECKSNSTPTPQLSDPLRRWRAHVGDSVASTTLVCDADSRLELGNGVTALPWRDVGDFVTALR